MTELEYKKTMDNRITILGEMERQVKILRQECLAITEIDINWVAWEALKGEIRNQNDWHTVQARIGDVPVRVILGQAELIKAVSAPWHD